MNKLFSQQEELQISFDEPVLLAFLDRVELSSHTEGHIAHIFEDEGDKISLSVNWGMWEHLGFANKVAVIVHEVMHIVSDHFSSAVIEGKNAAKLNIAQDMEINSRIFIEGRWELPKGLLLPDTEPFSYEYGLSWYDYYQLVDAELTDEEAGEIGGNDLIAPHSTFCKEELVSTFQNFLLSSGVANSLIAKQDTVHVEWASLNFDILQHLVANRVFNRGTDFKRPNKRYGLPLYAKKEKSSSRVGVIIDSSISITQADLNVFVQQAAALALRCKADVAFCSDGLTCDIDTNFAFGKLCEVTERKSTNLDKGIKSLINRGYDYVVVFTDGEYQSKLTVTNKILWVVTKNKKFCPRTGEVVFLQP